MPSRSWTPRVDVGECFDDLRRDWAVWRECSGTPTAATRGIVGEHRRVLRTNPYGPIFWMMLAYLQHSDGCLQPSVLEKARRVLARGAARIEWINGSPSVSGRQREMDRLAAFLRTPSSKPKPFGTRPLGPTNLRVGDVVELVDSGKRMVTLVVFRLGRYERERVPVCAAYRGLKPGTSAVVAFERAVPFLRRSDSDPAMASLNWKIKASGKPFSPVVITGVRGRWRETKGVSVRRLDRRLAVREGWGGLGLLRWQHVIEDLRAFLS